MLVEPLPALLVVAQGLEHGLQLSQLRAQLVPVRVRLALLAALVAESAAGQTAAVKLARRSNLEEGIHLHHLPASNELRMRCYLGLIFF
jgi:hypothetical protein